MGETAEVLLVESGQRRGLGFPGQGERRGSASASRGGVTVRGLKSDNMSNFSPAAPRSEGPNNSVELQGVSGIIEVSTMAIGNYGHLYSKIKFSGYLDGSGCPGYVLPAQIQRGREFRI